MSELKTNDKDVVVPGEILATGMEFLPSYGTYREGDKIFASRLGLFNLDGKVLKIIPLSGKYIPKKGDTIVGQVTEILMSGWRVEIGTAYSAVLGLRDASNDFINKGADLTHYFNIGDLIVTKIVNVTTQFLIDISMKGPGLRRLRGGRLIKVDSYKVPRIIGKQGSMVSMIKQATDCRIVVGQNGSAWLSGEPAMELLAEKVIRKIEKEAHISGLTDRIKTFLEKETKKKIELRSDSNGI
ncbi:MAG: exosome complex RNA-binding protein Rrp4 [Candidatus Woesearchaeota archaeon]|jgi:exosome complex component RRP4|nr:exosome complex RNA-binding protein Rrp4 [Candidatus Woesearchaeota archaeon]MDP7458156.1 exosome complex RNA-binding protein Rrp4 [Candidatus Woesearchaeota archaeon]